MAKTIQSTVAFQNAAGTAIANGILTLDLSQPSEITSGGGQVAPQRYTVTLDGTGKIPAATTILANDELTPSGTTYRARLFDSAGMALLADFGNWSIVGASPIDLSAMVPTTTGASYPTVITSVGLTMPAEFSVAGSPITSNGTLAVTKATETANTVWAGPTTGAAAAPTFRAIVAADLPTIGIAGGGTGQTAQTAAFNALSPVTTKGDIIVRDGTNNIRLAVGADNQVLTADSTQASGIKWAAAGGTGWSFSAGNKRWELFDSTITGWLVAAHPSLTIDVGWGSGAFVDENAVVDARLIAGGYPWKLTLTGSGTWAQAVNGDAINLTTGTSANNLNHVASGNSTITTFQTQYLNSILMVFDAIQSDANTTHRLGVGNTAADPPSNGIFLECLGADTNWQLVTRAAGVQTRADTGVARAAGTASWVITVSTTSVSAYVTGTAGAKATNTTNIPSSTQPLGPLFTVKTLTTAAKQLNLYHSTFVAKQVGL